MQRQLPPVGDLVTIADWAVGLQPGRAGTASTGDDSRAFLIEVVPLLDWTQPSAMIAVLDDGHDLARMDDDGGRQGP